MDASEFEFPPDQLDDDVAGHLPTFPTSAPSPTNAPFAYQTQDLPLSVLAQMPVEELPPTQPNNPRNFSIGQVMRGALSTAHMRPSSSATSSSNAGGLPRPVAGVAPLPSAAYTRPSSSLYLSTGHPPQPSTSSDEEDRRVGGGGGAGAEESLAQPESNNSSGAHNSHQLGESAVVTMTTFSGRQTRIDWSEAEVRSFYQALSQYGTDFSAIAVLFPRRSRSDIKRLYQRELRLKPKEVQQALEQKKPIDMAVFQERDEAKKKESQVPVATKKLNAEEQALVDEIENGLRAGAPSSSSVHTDEEADATLTAAALEAGEETTAAPVATTAKPRKRKRGVTTEELSMNAETAKRIKTQQQPALPAEDVAIEEETLFDMAMRRAREDNTPLASLFTEHTVPLDDSDFAFE